MTYLAELIDIPEQVHKSDFVISLASGITDPARTIDEYVATPQLAACFDRAMSLVTTAVADGRSKGAYLHGSFGSGKSHFMAILHLLLDRNTEARRITELADVIAKHDGALEGKKFLLVPYHFIGMNSMEQAILGGYAEHVRTRFPGSPAPARTGRTRFPTIQVRFTPYFRPVMPSVQTTFRSFLISPRTAAWSRNSEANIFVGYTT